MRTPSILIVEDRQDWRDILCTRVDEALREMNQVGRVHVATTFDDAWKALDQAGPWNVLITDIDLDGLSTNMGKQLVERAHDLGIPTLVVSGTPVLSLRDLRNMFREHEIKDFYTKHDFKKSHFIALVQQLVRAERPRVNESPPEVPVVIPPELLKQVQQGNVVLFCGAGISMSPDGLPSGGELAKELAEQAQLGDVENMSLPEIAQAYEIGMGRQSLIDYVVTRIEAASWQPLPTHHLIADLPFKYIITTNWDTLLEDALKHRHQPVLTVVRDTDISYYSELKRLLVKVHGSVEQRDTIIITGDDYYRVFDHLPETMNLLRGFFATRTMLFLGFGLGDQDFHRLYQDIVHRLGRHKRRDYAVQLNPSARSLKYWEQKGVQLITAEATSFLRQLAAMLNNKRSDQA